MVPEKTPGALWLRRFWATGLLFVAALAIVLPVWSIGFLGHDFLRTMNLLRSSEWENPEWTMAHAEIEFLRFQRELARAEGDPDADLDTLRLAFDIFYSRFETMEKGRIVDPLRVYPEYAENVAATRDFVAQALPLIDGSDEALRAGLGQLMALADATYPKMRRLTLVTLKNWTQSTVNSRRDMIRIMTQLTIGLSASFALLTVIGGVLARLYWLVRKRQKELERAYDRAVESETELRESQERFKRAAALVGLGHFTEARDDLRVLDCSESYAAIYGMSVTAYLERVATQGFLSMLHPADREAYVSAKSRARETRKPFEMEYRILRPDGHVRHIREVQRRSLVDGAGDALQEGIILDITGEKEADARLRQSEARLREAQTIAKLGGWELDSQGELYWSAETMRLLHMTETEFDGTEKSFFARCHPEDAGKVRNGLRKTWSRQVPYDLVNRIVLPSGEIRVIRGRAMPVAGLDGKTVKLVGTVQDVTEQARSEERLRQSQKMEAIGQLTGGVAHDFNNLLTVVMGNLELLREMGVDAEQASLIEAAIGAALRGADLTRNMLSFARQARLSPERLDVNETLREMERWSTRMLPATIEVVTDLEDPLPSVMADPSSTTNAVLNLILNARDAMPDGGRLEIRSRSVNLVTGLGDDGGDGEELPPGNYVCVSICDNGMGIPDAQRNSIFEPFFTTKPPGSGTGLGLSMVTGFMHQTGGMVVLDTAPGQGSSFHLYFPAEAAMTEAPAPRRQAADKVVPGTSILLAEDEPEVLIVLERTLTQAGYKVTTARSGDAAFGLFRPERFDLLVTDAVMPGQLQGTDLAAACRAQRPDLPVVFISGYAQLGDRARDMDEIWLMKPVERRDLLDTVAGAVTKVPA